MRCRNTCTCVSCMRLRSMQHVVVYVIRYPCFSRCWLELIPCYMQPFVLSIDCECCIPFALHHSLHTYINSCHALASSQAIMSVHMRMHVADASTMRAASLSYTTSSAHHLHDMST